MKQEEYLTEVEESTITDEIFSFRDFLFYFKKKLYVDTLYLESYLDIKVEVNGKEAVITYQDESYSAQL